MENPKTMDMPSYLSHKTVEAAQIRAIDLDQAAGCYILAFEGIPGQVSFPRGDSIFARYMPKVGDFLVRYGDGYLSFSPAKPFNEGYVPANGVSKLAQGVSASDAAIEKEIQAKGLSAPRLTPEQIAGTIKREEFWIVPGTTMTVCALELMNGYVVIGTSAAVSAENFDKEIGRKIAREKATDQIWAIEGYLLRERLHIAGRS